MSYSNTGQGKTADKNLARIRKQTETEERVKKGTQSKATPGAGNDDMIRTSSSEDKYQSGSPGHPMFAVDPELERQMAAQGVPQSIAGKKKQGAGKSHRSAAKKKPAKKSGTTPKTGPWNEKGAPRFASPEDPFPGPL